MKKFLSTLIGLLVVTLVFAAGALYAEPTKSPLSSPQFELPENARKVSENVYYLGAVEREGRVAEGYAFVDKRKVPAKPGTECGNGMCEPGENKNKCPVDCAGGGDDEEETTDTSSCYGFLANEAKWKEVEPWVVNPDNNSGMSSTSVSSTLTGSIIDWEDAADGNVDEAQGYDILGDGSSTSDVLEADTDSPDDVNEVYFDDIADSGAIGVTIVWGYFRGNPAWRELIEWDQIYDDADFDWSEDCESDNCTGKMDFPNISIHELGHSVGLDDLYDEKCSEMTMYGYGSEGETKKRSLEDGDVNGVFELYN